MYGLAKHTVMTDMKLRGFLVFVRAAVEHFTRSDGINRL